MSDLLWQPSAERIDASNVTAFIQRINDKHGTSLNGFLELHAWSVANAELFWCEVWDFCGVISSARGEPVLQHPEQMPGARWFPNATLNFAENLLRHDSNRVAIEFRGEDAVTRQLTYSELNRQVAALASALRSSGIKAGDRVAGFVPNAPESIVAMLAAASIGAVWSSCSPDFGVNGVVDRFGQIEPTVLFTADGYRYNGKWFDSATTVAGVVARLPTLQRVVVFAYDGEVATDQAAATHLQKACSAQADATTAAGGAPEISGWSDFLAPADAAVAEFAQLPFNHPLFIMFSSGTTGVPKCIVHGAGGTLLQHLKEHVLHVGLKPHDRTFFFTTCGWMMWNWLVSALAVEATVILYDGSPFYPDGKRMFDVADETGMTVFGTSAKFIDAAAKAGVKPRDSHKLTALHTILSTGSPLVAESFEYVYRDIKKDVCLSSISGGTDIVSCFMLGTETLPVHTGQIQAPGLGMQVEVFNDEGQAVRSEKGELVCAAPFPCMPVGFWNDPDGARYRSAYFERFEGVWCHGDYVEHTREGGFVIYGRSDAVLNPGGVRIGTAEIYRQVEQIETVVEALVIGQEWQGDVRVVLFVKLRDGVTLDETLEKAIRARIRENTTPRHVPAVILTVADIPRTKSGKIVELAVREVVHNRPVKNQEALANPEALAHFADRAELQEPS